MRGVGGAEVEEEGRLRIVEGGGEIEGSSCLEVGRGVVSGSGSASASGIFKGCAGGGCLVVACLDARGSLGGLANFLDVFFFLMLSFLGLSRSFAGDETSPAISLSICTWTTLADLGGLPLFFFVGLSFLSGFMAGLTALGCSLLGCGILALGSRD